MINWHKNCLVKDFTQLKVGYIVLSNSIRASVRAGDEKSIKKRRVTEMIANAKHHEKLPCQVGQN